MTRFGTMDDFLRRVDARRQEAERRAKKLPQDYESIDEYERDQMRSEPLPDRSNRRP